MTNTDRNMRLYAQVQNTPQEAQKSFNNGRFSGTDVNPMWRIKMLTMMFGPAGQGWWTEDEKFDVIPCPDTRETAVFCTLKLRYVDPESGEVSKPILGVGGNKFLMVAKSGPYCSDEAYKMAYTDALSIACKALGFSHDIYFQNDKTKYTMPVEHTEESSDLVNQITEKMKVLKGKLTKEEQKAFVDNVMLPTIGTLNYKTCTDVSKLKMLLAQMPD